MGKSAKALMPKAESETRSFVFGMIVLPSFFWISLISASIEPVTSRLMTTSSFETDGEKMRLSDFSGPFLGNSK